MPAVWHLSLTSLTTKLPDGINVKSHADTRTGVTAPSRITHGRTGQITAGSAASVGPEACRLTYFAYAIAFQRAALCEWISTVDLPQIHIINLEPGLLQSIFT